MFAGIAQEVLTQWHLCHLLFKIEVVIMRVYFFCVYYNNSVEKEVVYLNILKGFYYEFA